MGNSFGVGSRDLQDTVTADAQRVITFHFSIHVSFCMHRNALTALLIFKQQRVGIGPGALGRASEKTTLCLVGREAPGRCVLAFVNAAGDQWAVGLAVQERHHHFIANPGDVNAAEATARRGLGDANPAGTLFFFALAVGAA